MNQLPLPLQAAEADLLHRPMLAIRHHPRFDAAATVYVDKLIVWRQRLGLFNRVGTNLGFHIINYVVYLHFSARNGGVEHGATFSNLLQICEARGNCGSRALRSVLTVLVLLGRLHAGRADTDKRVQTYVPSDALMQEVREVYGFSLGVVDHLFDGTDFAVRMQADPEFIAKLISGTGRAIIEDDVRITEHFPDLHSIINRAGGLPTSLSLAGAQLRGQAFPSPATIARDFSISTSQVRGVIQELAARNLITRAVDGHVLEASPLVVEHKGLIAREIALHVKFGLDIEARLIEAPC